MYKWRQIFCHCVICQGTEGEWLLLDQRNSIIFTNYLQLHPVTMSLTGCCDRQVSRIVDVKSQCRSATYIHTYLQHIFTLFMYIIHCCCLLLILLVCFIVQRQPPNHLLECSFLLKRVYQKYIYIYMVNYHYIFSYILYHVFRPMLAQFWPKNVSV